MTNFLSHKAMLANLTISQWGARRLDKQITDEVNSQHGASQDAGRYNKLLIAKSALDPIQKIVSEARTLHVMMTQPWLDAGTRLLPAALYLKYAERMKALEAKFNAAVDVFCENYEAHVEKRRADLNDSAEGMFRERDYPAPSVIRSKFDFAFNVLPVPHANDFRVALAKEHADDIKRDIERSMKKALTVAMQEPFSRIQEVVGHMATRLKAYSEKKEGERTGTFRDTLVENVRELVGILPAFNLTDDAALTQVVERMERELCVEDAQALRDNPDARETVQKSAEDILAHVSQFM